MFENKGIVEDIPDGTAENANMPRIASYVWQNGKKITERLIEQTCFFSCTKTEHFIVKKQTKSELSL